MTKKNTSKSATQTPAPVATVPVRMFRLKSPKGKIYETDNLTKFVRRFTNLERTALSKVIHGHRTSHKGWTAVTE